MSKSQKNVADTNTTENNVASTLTFDEACALVPAKEHRSFTEAEFNKVSALKFPDSAAEVKAFSTGKTAGEVFAIALNNGKTEAVRVAKLFQADGVVLKPSAASSFKSVVEGKTEYWAGKLAYGILSYVKNS